MFEMGAEMLAREGYQLPEPTRMQDGSETPRGIPSAAGGAGMPVLLGQVGGGGLSVAAAAAAPSAARASVEILGTAACWNASPDIKPFEPSTASSVLKALIEFGRASSASV